MLCVIVDLRQNKIRWATHMSKFIPPYPCNTHFSDYLDGGVRNLPFNWEALSSHHAAENTVLVENKPLETASAYDVTTRASGNDNRDWFVSELSRVCEIVLNKKVVNMDFPGGKYRSACRLYLEDGKSVIASRRQDPGRTSLERHVLTKLKAFTRRIPEVKAFNGVVLIQEDLPGTRLSSALKRAPVEHYERLATEALDSLVEIHTAADLACLDQAVPLLGYHHKWLSGLIEQPAIIGNYLKLPCPNPPINEIYDLLTIMRPRFIKWDTRPGNAMVDENNKISWFDWEHCCARNRLDDMVWLLCDEIMPYHPEAEERLIAAFLPQFADGADLNYAHAYLRVFGILHMSVRLGGIISEKGDRPWMLEGDSEFHLAEDALVQAKRLCDRAANWSKKSIYPNSMAHWFNELSALLSRL